MGRFFVKLALHSLLILSLVLAIVVGRYLRDAHTSTLDLSSLPTNFISNSVCFNTKLEHARTANRLVLARTLVLGSSMALNNVSGSALAQKLHAPVYNLSSWGLKPAESYQMLKQIGDKLTIQHLIVPFNHTEFKKDSKSIDYESISTYLKGEDGWQSIHQYLANFTLDGFIKDWTIRSNFRNRSNSNMSMNFDEAGTVMCRQQNFVFDKAGHRTAYQDTTGFRQFTASIDSIRQYCDRRNIELTLVYLPWKREVLSADKRQQVNYVANYLTKHYNSQFVDLSNVQVPSLQYFDACHMFEGGANIVTRALTDSLTHRYVSTRLASIKGRQASSVAAR